MTVATKPKIKLSPDEYLESEKSSLIKREYRQGDIYEMVGASDSHVTIALNLASMLKSFFKFNNNKNCRVYISDMKVKVASINAFFYPDIMVTCEEKDRQSTYFKEYPQLIIEVLSESTERYDRGDKFASYRQMESLQEYILISQDKMQVECFRKNSDNLWVLYPYDNQNNLVEFPCLNFSFSLTDLYENVSLNS